jgi:hypothetical protein
MPNVAQQLKAAYDRMDALTAQLRDADKRQVRELREARQRNDAAQHLTSREHLMELDARGREYQERAEDALAPWGIRAPARTDGEPLGDYRRRLAGRLQKRLPEDDQWYGKNLARLDDANFAVVEPQIYAAAKQAAYRPDSAPEGGMREIVERDGNGNKIIRFVGKTSFVCDPAYGHRPGRRVAAFMRPSLGSAWG